jgi:hypothetical protein
VGSISGNLVVPSVDTQSIELLEILSTGFVVLIANFELSATNNYLLHVPIHTGTYRYIPVHTILPDPVQVYRIPDGRPALKPTYEYWNCQKLEGLLQ